MNKMLALMIQMIHSLKIDDDDVDDDNDIVVFQKNKKGSTSKFMAQCCATKRTEFLLLVKR